MSRAWSDTTPPDPRPSRLAVMLFDLIVRAHRPMFGWRLHCCVICREEQWMRGRIAACRRCRRDPDAAGDAAWLNIVRHINQAARRIR